MQLEEVETGHDRGRGSAQGPGPGPQNLGLGATGCSYHPTQGTGSRSVRHDDVFGENFQMKIVCPQDVAEKS